MYFISIEGPECSGKTTLIQRLFYDLQTEGYNIAVTREPGGCEFSEKIRKLLLDKNNNISPETETLLFAAARSEFVRYWNKTDYDIILSDRCIDSSLVYQGCGYQNMVPLDDVRKINDFALHKWRPNLTVVLLPDEKVFESRLSNKNKDRIESYSLDYHKRVYKYFSILPYLDIVKRDYLFFKGAKTDQNFPNSDYEKIFSRIHEKLDFYVKKS